MATHLIIVGYLKVRKQDDGQAVEDYVGNP